MVAKTPAWESRPHLNVDFPVFDITTTHDLLATATLFGLEAATDRSRGHFPRLSDSPLAIEQASQSATASVSALGFRAAAVSLAALMAGGGPPHDKTKVVRVSFDRPFGFLVVDRTSCLVLFAGWVADPTRSSKRRTGALVRPD